jgi:pimeloyl-ACP methyl ester carboxylesterase
LPDPIGHNGDLASAEVRWWPKLHPHRWNGSSNSEHRLVAGLVATEGYQCPGSHLLAVLLDALDFDRAWVGGQSMGATVAIDFALAHPDRAAGLVLAPPLPVLGWEWVEGFPVKPALELIATEGPDAAKAAFLDLPLHASAMEIPEIAALMRRMYADYSGWHYRHSDPGRFEAADQVSRLSEITAPSLVMVGGRDVLDARLTAERVAADVPHVEHRVIEHVGHYPNLEEPDLFNETVVDFLSTTA